MKRYVLAAAALPLVASLALAQSTTAPTTTTPPAATSPATPSAGTAGQPQWYTRKEGEYRSSKLIGTKVKNGAGETIGDINEVLLAKDGKAAAVVIGVGGFLGVGEREVAVAFDSLKVNQDSSGNNVVMLDATKDSLKGAPAWSWQRS